jgi:hypothetical protein
VCKYKHHDHEPLHVKKKQEEEEEEEEEEEKEEEEEEAVTIHNTNEDTLTTQHTKEFVIHIINEETLTIHHTKESDKDSAPHDMGYKRQTRTFGRMPTTTGGYQGLRGKNGNISIFRNKKIK